MWNRPALLLWVSVRIRKGPGKRGFSIAVPLPLFLLTQWTDMAEDALLLARLVPAVRRNLSRYAVFPFLTALRRFEEELRRCGPEEIAEIDVESAGGQAVRVRCVLK